MDVSSSSSFYEAPVNYDEGKTIELLEKVETNFQDVEGLLGGIEKKLLKFQKQSGLTVKLIEKLRSAQTDAGENRNTNRS